MFVHVCILGVIFSQILIARFAQYHYILSELSSCFFCDTNVRIIIIEASVDHVLFYCYQQYNVVLSFYCVLGWPISKAPLFLKSLQILYSPIIFCPLSQIY